ncbi:hypothetical protein SAMN05421510_105918 [Nitrosomonas ureae]|uniref:Uncharacterized protein n=1 Tax=Nitrosomonas ureae TaxID=44577 RepID=A0A1H9GB91_9PROT|nr:hypothetical protein SAMN05421510_105918 [Nitrosomonas ureae]
MPYDFGLVQTIDGLGHGIVIRISDTANRNFNIGLNQAFRIANRQILATVDALLNVKQQFGYY